MKLTDWLFERKNELAKILSNLEIAHSPMHLRRLQAFLCCAPIDHRLTFKINYVNAARKLLFIRSFGVSVCINYITIMYRKLTPGA